MSWFASRSWIRPDSILAANASTRLNQARKRARSVQSDSIHVPTPFANDENVAFRCSREGLACQEMVPVRPREATSPAARENSPPPNWKGFRSKRLNIQFQYDWCTHESSEDVFAL